MKILKFGGTSVGNPQRIKNLAHLTDIDESRIIVLSAVSGTTNRLVQITNALYESDVKKASSLIAELRANYEVFVEELFLTDVHKLKGAELIKAHFDYLTSFTFSTFTIFEEKAVLAQGELISSALFHFYLSEIGKSSILLQALDFMKINEDSEPDLQYIEENLIQLLSTYPNEKMFVTQGYICRNAFGEIDNLKRGGSDYTASLIGAALRASEIQIWTDIDGMHNNDPRIVDKTFPIAELSFDEAAELAYFGAKILHPTCILPAQLRNIPVRLLNTMQPESKGTVITSNSSGKSIKAVAAKDEICSIKIKSTRMLLAHGFLRRIFEIFERYKKSIDMITTSEVGVSLTIDDVSNIEPVITELQKFCTIEMEYNQTIICVVGDCLSESNGIGAKILDCLKTIPVNMISCGGSKNNISLLIPSKYKAEALQSLNKGLFNL